VAGCSVAGSELVLRLRGELDSTTAPDLETALEDILTRGHRQVVLDLSELRFLDAAGANLLVRAAARCAAVDGRLTVTHPARIVARVLSITGLDAVLLSGRAGPHRSLGHRDPGTDGRTVRACARQ
jgi:anti-sigma B factor antagonist